jgi:hypothetical protein
VASVADWKLIEVHFFGPVILFLFAAIGYLVFEITIGISGSFDLLGTAVMACIGGIIGLYTISKIGDDRHGR